MEQSGKSWIVIGLLMRFIRKLSPLATWNEREHDIQREWGNMEGLIMEAAAPISRNAMTEMGFSYFPRRMVIFAKGWIMKI